MREIKFRAWDKRERKMVYDINLLSSSKHNSAWICDAGGGGFFNPLSENYELMQYTGLKDKNGKEIYEGDIVKRHRLRHDGSDCAPCPYEVKFGIGEVDASDYEEYSVSICGFYLEPNGNDYMPPSSIAEIIGDLEVIGNIYENKELLEA